MPPAVTLMTEGRALRLIVATAARRSSISCARSTQEAHDSNTMHRAGNTFRQPHQRHAEGNMGRTDRQ